MYFEIEADFFSGSAIAAVLSSYRFSVASSLLTIDEVPFVGFADEEEVPALLAATTTTITTTTSGRRKSVGEEESELRLREIENDLGEIMERKARVEKRVEALKEQMGELEEECKTTWELREEGGALEKEKGTRMKGAAVKFEREKRRWSLRWELKRMWRVWRA